MATKFVFVTGGVLSSLGKGLASASIGSLLESRRELTRLAAADNLFFHHRDPKIVAALERALAAQQGFGHLGAGRVVDAEKQNAKQWFLFHDVRIYSLC